MSKTVETIFSVDREEFVKIKDLKNALYDGHLMMECIAVLKAAMDKQQVPEGCMAATIGYFITALTGEVARMEPGDKIKVSDADFYRNVYGLLVIHAGALERERNCFVASHISAQPCDEYRIIGGNLGFGGKYWRKSNRVTCYPEDETPVRVALIACVNGLLAEEARESGRTFDH